MQDSIAIIGISCKFPGAKDKDEFWNNLITGKETVKRFSDDELKEQEYNWEQLKNNPAFVKARGVLDDVDMWDPGFFNMIPKDAKVMDPQQRLWLENTWHAFEDAGCNPFNYNGIIGVFAGSSPNSYLLNNVLRDPETYELYIRGRSPEVFQKYLNSDPMFLSTKTAYLFNLKGPAVSVQSACSTSLVAISQACSSLQNNESDICVAGGVSVIVPQEMGYIFQEGAIGSPDGRCRPFDKDSAGTVFGNGVGTVILKRLKDAVRDNDRIYSVISGWATNNDGNQKVGYTAPGVDGQANAIRKAQEVGQLNGDEITYIEAHGTATPLGDPIEVAALTKAFRQTTREKQFCGLGSVKSNIGHLDTAAGVAGLIKVSLSAYNKIIPATLHYKEENPRIDFKNSPFYVVDNNIDCSNKDKLHMGVSSFGVGGTNAHVIVSDYKKSEKKINSSRPGLLLLSAKSEHSIEQMQLNLKEYLNDNTKDSLEDICYTLQNRRMHMPLRSFALANKEGAVLSSFLNKKYDSSLNQLSFVFPGQGAQLAQMGSDLYHTEPVFRACMDECFALYHEATGGDLKNVIFSKESGAEKLLAQTQITQPALFTVEYALAKLYMHYGLMPSSLIGHSIGEYTAATVAGVFDLKTAMLVVCKRGELMQSMPEGNMMAVFASSDELKEIAGELFEIAAINSQSMSTISFNLKDNDAVIALLDEKGLSYTALNTSHAFHSKDFEPILEEFASFVDGFSLKEPQLPFISCLTGTTISNDQATSGSYWAKQLRNSVQFSKGIDEINEYDDVVFLEVGPNTHLSGLIRQNATVSDKSLIVNSLGKKSDDTEQVKFYKSIGELWMRGIEAKFELFYENKPSVANVPLYAFDKKRYWIDYTPSKQRVLPLETKEDSIGLNVVEGENSSKEAEDPFKQIWIDVFGLDDIKETDDFFDLGGHSLLALQIISRIKDQFSITISLKEFLAYPSIEKLKSLKGDISLTNNGTNIAEQIEHLTNLKRLPLTNAQKRLWLINKINGSSPAYNIPFTFHLTGSLDVEIFQKSLEILFDRHHIVHASFKEENDEPYYQINEKEVLVRNYDISAVNQEDKNEELNRIIGEDARLPFELDKDKLYRLLLIKCNQDDYFFHTTIHHIVFDGLSWGVFVRDLNVIYESLINNIDVPLQPIKFQQYDYAHWLNKHGEEEDLTRSISFWKDKLAGVPEYTKFPFDRPRSDKQRGFGRSKSIALPSKLSKKICDYSKKNNVTSFYTMLSAFSLLIKKYSGENDFCIGSPVSNRPHDFLENIFGMFVNTITFRYTYDEINNFDDLIKYTKNTVLEAIEHQSLSFDRVVEEVNPSRSLLYNPIFQIAFAWQDALNDPIQTSSLKGQRLAVEHGIAPFDLTLYMWEVNGVIEGELEYNIDLFEDTTISRIRENFIVLLNELMLKPKLPFSEVSIISKEESIQISDFNNTRTNYPKEKTVVDLFEEQVVKVPNKIAISYNNKSYSYKKLNRRVNQLARRILSLGLEPQQPIGLIVDKSNEMIIAILAILKVNCFYVPIDPEYPQERIDYILGDSGCVIVLANKLYNELIPSKIKSINLDRRGSYKSNSRNLNLDVSTRSAAYAMYTSGTTGKPKGSKIAHQSIIRLVRDTNYITLSSSDNILLTGAVVFDATTFEIWGALLNGGTLYIVDKETLLSPRDLGLAIADNSITTLWLTSGLFTQLSESNTYIFKGLKNLLVGGDVLSCEHINKVRKIYKGLKVINGYGPTENTTFSTCHIIDKEYSSNIPIGKPISNSTAYILMKDKKLAPIGVIGEIYLGGDGLSIGYINNQALNKEKFIPSPFKQGDVLYKSGDLGRWLPDGAIEFNGRVDNQIKIRGFRVELEEIESILRSIEGVVEAVVKTYGVDKSYLQLVTFLQLSEKITISKDQIEQIAKLKLPTYMMPSIFEFVDELPKTLNGKIDRKKLIVPEVSVNFKKVEQIRLTKVQKELMIIWSKVLKHNNISIHDNFFDVGGNSLLGISLVSEIESTFGIEFNLRKFFDAPIINDISSIIEVEFNQMKIESDNFNVINSTKNDSIIGGEL